MEPPPIKESHMRNWKELEQILREIDGRGYKGYLELRGGYECERFCLFIDHIQGDPFAAPSKIRIRVTHSEAKIPIGLRDNAVRRLAVGDYLIRRVHREIPRVTKGGRGMGKSGLISIDVGGQEVLARTAIKFTESWVEVRMEVGLPAAGRTILGRQAYDMLCEDIPHIIQAGLLWKESFQDEGQQFVHCVENQVHIRSQLQARELVAFLADGSVLPRESGRSDCPFRGKNLQVFQSPSSLRVTLSLLYPMYQNGVLVTELAGMGIPKGITLIVGGGYHGKSTLLQALARSVYPHIPGDGRENVVTHPDAVKIRAEDGRRVEGVNLSGFISNLPFGQATTEFSTNNASGSTSQAATLLEAVEVGATVLLIDEDTSATNFMVRDARMQQLVKKSQEPITPFVDRVKELYRDHGVSTILVMGGCGDYFDVADTVIMMQEYQPVDVTDHAKTIGTTHPTQRAVEVTSVLPDLEPRVLIPTSIDASRGRREVHIDARGVEALIFGHETVDLSAVEQIVDPSQVRAIGYGMYVAAQQMMDGKRNVTEVLKLLMRKFEQEDLDWLSPFGTQGHHPGNFAKPRSFEIASAINRLRTIQMRPGVRAS